jgi:hypothetical protein
MNGMAEQWDEEKRCGGASPWGFIDPVGTSVNNMCVKTLYAFAKEGACDTSKSKPDTTAAAADEEPPRDKAGKRKGQAGPANLDAAPTTKKTKKEHAATSSAVSIRGWQSRTKLSQLVWTTRNLPAFKDKFDVLQCLAAQLPASYTTFVCPGDGHAGAKGQTSKPAHGKCLVKACKNRTNHKTKDSADCMAAIEEAHEAGNKAFITRATK